MKLLGVLTFLAVVGLVAYLVQGGGPDPKDVGPRVTKYLEENQLPQQYWVTGFSERDGRISIETPLQAGQSLADFPDPPKALCAVLAGENFGDDVEFVIVDRDGSPLRKC